MKQQPAQQSPPNPGFVTDKVLGIVARALDLEAGDVQLSSSLIGELGAESLDLLDIVFNLEREFEVRLPRENILQRANNHFGEESIISGGVLTPFGRALILKSMPEVDSIPLPVQLRPESVPALITPRSFVRLVSRLLEARADKPKVCQSCSATLLDSENYSEIICPECGEAQKLPSGDEILLADMIELAGRLGAPTTEAKPEASTGPDG